MHYVPSNVDAAIVPKTLFGEKYVDLLPPRDADEARLADGDVITQSRTAVELGDVYAELVPLLRSIDPAQLSTVLTTLARTLDGKGDQLGRTIVATDEFLGRLNPSLDVLQADLRRLTETLRIYDEAAPDLLETLANSSAISTELLVPAEQRLRGLLDTLVTTSDTTDEVLNENGDDLIRLTGRARPLLALLDEYSSVLPCSLKGLHTLDKLGNQITGARGPFTLLNVDVLVQGDPYVYPRDLPASPSSDASDNRLPRSIPSFAPHCPRFTRTALQVRDAAPFSLSPLAFQTIPGTSPSSTTPDPTASGDTQLVDPRLADALGQQLAGRDDGLAGLLLNPMLFDGVVRLP